MNAVNETKIIRIYPVKEWKRYFGERKFISIEDLERVNKIKLRQNYAKQQNREK